MSVNHDDFAALAQGYALGTLTGEEARTFASHLQTCDECRRSVRDMAAVGEALGRALPPQTPPPGLRDRVLTRATSPVVTDRRVESGTVVAKRHAVRLARGGRGPRGGRDVGHGLAVSRRGGARADSSNKQTVLQVQSLEQQMAADFRPAYRPRHKHARCWPLETWLALNSRASRLRLAPRAGSSGARPTAWCSPPRIFRLFLPDAFTSCGWLPIRRLVPASPSRPAAVSSASSRHPRRRRGRRRLHSTIEPEGGRPAPTGPMFLLGSF